MFEGIRDSWKTLTKHIIGYLVAFLIGVIIAVVLFFSVETVGLFLQLVNLFFILMLFFRINIHNPKQIVRIRENPRKTNKKCPDCGSGSKHKKDCPRKVKT